MEEIKDKDYSLEAVPESARKGFRSMFFVMLGFTFFSASMSGKKVLEKCIELLLMRDLKP